MTMSVPSLTDIRNMKALRRAQNSLGPLIECACTDPTAAMAAAAIWIGSELSKLSENDNPKNIRETLIWFMDDEAKKKPRKARKT